MTTLMGFFRTWIHVPLPLVYGEYLPRERQVFDKSHTNVCLDIHIQFFDFINKF